MLVWAYFALVFIQVNAQNIVIADHSGEIPVSDLDKLTRSYSSLSRALQEGSLGMLARMEHTEAKLQQKLLVKDSATKILFEQNSQHYQELFEKLHAPVDLTIKNPLKEYIPSIDSLSTAIGFLRQSHLSGLSSDHLQKLTALAQQLTIFQTRLQQADNIKAYIKARKDHLKASLEKYGLTHPLVAMNKEIYYYQERLKEYKAYLHDRDKLTRKLLSVVQDQPAFKNFFLKNSYLSALFRLPGNDGEATGKPIPGLPTRSEVAARVAERLGPGASFAQVVAGENQATASGNPLTDGVSQAKEKMDQWKDKVTRAGGGGSTVPLPDFTPNSQHNKTFFQRMQVNFDIQSQQHSAWTPAISTLGLNLGYMLNNRSIFGAGVGYKIGWGQPFSHISFSSQGASLRSFFQWRWKGSVWLSGGYEANYYNAFDKIASLKNIKAWQASGLAGIMKTYRAGKRIGNIQLLYDLLHAQHLPQSPALIFRAGYSFH
jgi:hypothetical protein